MLVRSRRGMLLDWGGLIFSAMFVLALTFGLVR